VSPIFGAVQHDGEEHKQQDDYDNPFNQVFTLRRHKRVHVLIKEQKGSIVYFRCECGEPFGMYLPSQVDAFDVAIRESLLMLLKEHRSQIGELSGLRIRKSMMHPTLCHY